MTLNATQPSIKFSCGWRVLFRRPSNCISVFPFVSLPKQDEPPLPHADFPGPRSPARRAMCPFVFTGFHSSRLAQDLGHPQQQSAGTSNCGTFHDVALCELTFWAMTHGHVSKNNKKADGLTKSLCFEGPQLFNIIQVGEPQNGGFPFGFPLQPPRKGHAPGCCPLPSCVVKVPQL